MAIAALHHLLSGVCKVVLFDRLDVDKDPCYCRRYQAQYHSVPDGESSNMVTTVITLPETFGECFV